MDQREAIFGLKAESPFPEGWTALEAVAVVKCLTEDGKMGLFLAVTENLSMWETVGMLTGALDVEREGLKVGFEEEP